MKVKSSLLLILFLVVYNAQATKYYVNDGSTSNDIYCTATGNNVNNGTSPATPKLNLSNILSTYAASFSAGDTIFVDAGTYNTTSDRDLSSPINGVVIKGASVLRTIFSRVGSDHYFMLINDNNTQLIDMKIVGYDNQTISGVQSVGVASNITGVKLTNLQIDGCATTSTGGGYPIEIASGANVQLNGGGVTCNSWDAGGGIQISGATTNVIIRNYQFIGNYQLWGNGTALKINNGTINIYNSRFESNKIGGDKSGMGIDMSLGTVNVYDCNFKNNETNILANNIGGAVSVHGGTFRITRSTFTGNVPQSATSGIYGAGIGVTGGTVTIDSCGFSGNVGARANDVYVSGGNVSANNCTFGSAANQVGQAGTGVFTIATSGTPTKYGTVTSSNTNAPTYIANPTLPNYLPVSCVAIPCTTPTITSGTPTSTICSGSRWSTALGSSTTSGQTTYSWTSTAVTGITGHALSGTGNITEVLTNTTSGSLTVTYTVTPTFNLSCNGAPVTYSVVVEPAATITSTTGTICSGVALNFSLTSNVNSTYTWQAANNTNTTGETTSLQSTSSITDNITNSTTSSQNVIYSVTPTSTAANCPGAVQTVTITVNPAPQVTSANTTSICSGVALSYGLTSNPASNFTWIAADNANTTGESTSIQSSNTVINTIINSSNSASQNVIYTVTPTSTSGSCIGSSQTLTVTVNPTPVITSGNSSSVCSGIALNYNLTSSTPSIITWIAADNTNTSGESTSSQTSSSINNTIINSSASSQTVIYTVTSTSTTGSCLGTAQTLSVLVNPTPNVTSSNNQAICSGTALNLALTSNVPSSFTWIASDNANTNGESTSTQNSSLINDIISHAQATSQDVFYTITPTATIGNCLGTSLTLTVTVNPTPVVDALSNPASNCAGQTVNAFTFTTSPAGATVNWTNNNLNTGLVANGVGSPINGFIANNVSVQEISTVSLTPTLGTCIGASASYTLTINPNPTLVIGALDILNPSSCGNNNGHIIGLTINGAPTIQYSWNNGAFVTPDLNGLVAGTYNLLATDGNGCTVDTSLTLSDPAAPNAPAFTISTDTVCDGGTTTLSITNPDINTTYNWVGPLGPVGTGTTITISPASEINEGTYNASATLAGCTGGLSLSPISLIVNENPVVQLTPNANSFCEDANLVLTANVTNPGGTATIPVNGYQWILNSNPISGANASTYTTNQAGTYELIVTNSNNCSSTNASLAVTINSEPAISLSSALIDSADCSGANGSISNINVNSGTADYTFNWFNGSNNLLSSTISSSNAIAPLTNVGAGNYTLIVIDSKGCNDTVSVTINNFTPPTTPAIASNPSNCSGAILNPISVTGTGVTFNWYGDISLTNLLGNGNPFTPNLTSTDTLYVTQSLHNCESAGTEVIVLINPTPNAPTALGATYCQGQTIQNLTASGGTGTINWYSDNTLGSLLGTGTPFNSGITSTDTVYVNETTLGCTGASTEIIITINALPALPIVTASGPLTFCDGNSVTLTANPSNGIVWSPSGSTNASITVTTNGSFSVTYTDNNNCSSTSANTDVVVNTNPTSPTLSLSSGSASFCSGDSATISASPNTGLTWSNGSNNSSIVVTASGSYNAFITDANNCASPTASININVNNNPTIGTSFLIDTAYCNLSSGGIHNTYVNGGTNPYIYQWQSNNVTVGTDSILANSTSGSYIFIVVDQNGCSDTSSAINIPSGNGIDINLVSDIYTGYEPSNANLISSIVSGNPINYSWYLNSTLLGGQTSSTLTLNSLTQGTYETSVVANDIHGCTDSVTVKIIIEAQIKIIIPNVFTPNGDGINDAFTFTTEGLKDLEIVIYDRWGILLYEQKATVLSWDGKLKSGQLATDGTYYFMFSGKDIKDNLIEKQGYVTLIK